MKAPQLFTLLKIFTFLFLLTLAFSACSDQNIDKVNENHTNEMTSTHTSEAPLLRHMVIFKYKDSSRKEDIQKVHEMFLALPSSIPAIKDYEWGLNDSPENFHQGFTHCYLLTFESESDRDSIYTPHPDHQAFVSALQPHLEKVFVVDYWAKNP